MTKNERKEFNAWAVGTVEEVKQDTALDYEEGSDFLTALNSIPRVQYLKILGYTIDTWEAYAFAEINEMKKSA